MKNIFLKLTAAVLSALMFTACGSEKIKNEPTPEPTEPALGQPFRELTKSDFKGIDVSVTISEGLEQVEVKSLDLTQLDFGEKLPACKTAEDYEKYRPDVSVEGSVYFDDSLTIPAEGMALKCWIDGKDLYFKVSYDYFSCTHGEHEWSIYKYDTESGALDEVYSYSSADEELCVPEAVIDGKVYMYTEEDNVKKILEYDPETTGVRTIFEAYEFTVVSGEELIISDGVSEMQYDPESGGWRELASKIELESGDVKAYSDNEIVSKLIKSENSRNADLLTDYYRLQTEATSAEILYASKNKAVLCTDDNKKLLTYDLDKKERYMTDISDIAKEVPVYAGGDLIFLPYLDRGEYTNAYIFSHESGIASPISDSLPKYYGKSDDIVCFAETSATVTAMEREIHYYDFLTKLKWIEF